MYKKMTILSILFVVIDQGIKWIVSHFLPFQKAIEVIPNFFYLDHVHNDGAAWSILSGNVVLLSMIGIVAIILIYYFFLKDKKLSSIEIVIYSLLIGGILGNLIDRIFLGYVIDYFSFSLFGYYFPVFNIADMEIVISVIFMILFSVKEEMSCKKLSSKNQ